MMIILLMMILTACGRANADNGAEPSPLDLAAYNAGVDRTLTFLDKSSFIVTRHGSDEKNQGDSLIFTGIMLSVVPCDKGETAAAAILAMPPELYRHPSIAEQPVSLDGALGLYLGIAQRIKHCGEAARWKDFLAAHVKTGTPEVPQFFDYVRDRVAAEAAGDTITNRGKDLEIEVAGWAAAVKLHKSACYRINLGFLALRTLEVLGDAPSRNEFCAATQGTDLPTVEHWCGRQSLVRYLEDYKVNEWQYRHQRCVAWEDPDGNGDDQPGLDYLVAWRQYYGG